MHTLAEASVAPAAQSVLYHTMSVVDRATGARTLSEMVVSGAGRGRDVALSSPHPDGPVEVTYGELVERARAIARGLIAIGIEAGDRVSILGSTSRRLDAVRPRRALRRCGRRADLPHQLAG